MSKSQFRILSLCVLALLLLMLLKYLGFFSYIESVFIENSLRIEFLGVIGSFIVAISSIALFYVNIRKRNNDFVTLKLEVSDKITCKVITSTIENPVNSYKYIKFACLVISPVVILEDGKKAKDEKNNAIKGESNNDYYFLQKLNEFTNSEISCTNDIVKLKEHKAFISDENTFAFVPLTFFYTENIRFGNETVSYSYPLMNNSLEEGVYDVRLFVFRHKGLHRTTHQIIEINNNNVI